MFVHAQEQDKVFRKRINGTFYGANVDETSENHLNL